MFGRSSWFELQCYVGDPHHRSSVWCICHMLKRATEPAFRAVRTGGACNGSKGYHGEARHRG